jgi:hypothetical protein
MTDKELVKFASEFRRGILGGRVKPFVLCYGLLAIGASAEPSWGQL